jgi:hypothetical protein
VETISAVQIKPVSYLAMMSSDRQPDHFALVAYQGDKPGRSSIRVQWNLNTKIDKATMSRAMVWMRDRNTGKLRLIASLAHIDHGHYMPPDEWQALKNSAELLVTANANPKSPVLYQGKCIELSGWKST